MQGGVASGGMEPEEPTLTWVTITEADPRVRVLSERHAMSWFVDITFSERAQSRAQPNRTYLIGTLAENWYVGAADAVDLVGEPVPVSSIGAGKHQAEEWERAIQ